MELFSDKSYSEASGGIIVCIPVPEVDRRGCARSVLAVIIEKTSDGVYAMVKTQE